MSKYQNDSDNLQIASSTRRLLEQLILAHRGAFSLSTTIVDRDYKICEGDLRLNWNGNGYKTILDVLIRTIPDRSKQLPFYEKLLLNKEVTNIAWNGTNGNITVSCSDGSIYAAAQVIFTPSVGVLKYNHKTLFSPPLPEDKQIAIENIGLDAIVDVSFYFPERWWPHDDDFRGFYFVWDEEDANDVIKQTVCMLRSEFFEATIRSSGNTRHHQAVSNFKSNINYQTLEVFQIKYKQQLLWKVLIQAFCIL